MYEPVIGLEVHAQLLTATKAFCSCKTTFGEPPNTHVCPTCLGLPGALPVLNERAVRFAVRAALALGCTIERTSRFARKNYFYPDLPKGYQISQYDEPFSRRGVLHLDTKNARITRVHMEEDAGKNIHGELGTSRVDFNRSGVPLVEIVGEPDLRSGEEAAEYLRALREILLFLGVNDGNLEEGSFRCDANVSIRPAGSDVLGTRVELKNINSFRFVQKAIEHEVARQTEVVESGGRVAGETRGWDEDKGVTYAMRSKETAPDYRYFPEPDLPPLVLDEAYVAEVAAEMPELPRAKRARYAEKGLPAAARAVLTRHPKVAAAFEELAEHFDDWTEPANFFVNEIVRDVTERGLDAKLPIAMSDAARILDLQAKGVVTRSQRKLVYRDVVAGKSVEKAARAFAEAPKVDAAALRTLCERIVAENPKQAEQLRGGKTGVMGYFVGRVMKETKGGADAKLVKELLGEILGLR